MSFIKKMWKDRISEYPNRRMLTKEDNTTELVLVAREEGEIAEPGDAFSANEMNDLEDRIGNKFESIDINALWLVKADDLYIEVGSESEFESGSGGRKLQIYRPEIGQTTVNAISSVVSIPNNTVTPVLTCPLTLGPGDYILTSWIRWQQGSATGFRQCCVNGGTTLQYPITAYQSSLSEAVLDSANPLSQTIVQLVRVTGTVTFYAFLRQNSGANRVIDACKLSAYRIA